jgi:hypothetical protein
MPHLSIHTLTYFTTMPDFQCLPGTVTTTSTTSTTHTTSTAPRTTTTTTARTTTQTNTSRTTTTSTHSSSTTSRTSTTTSLHVTTGTGNNVEPTTLLPNQLWIRAVVSLVVIFPITSSLKLCCGDVRKIQTSTSTCNQALQVLSQTPFSETIPPLVNATSSMANWFNLRLHTHYMEL